jgi:prepilin-type N-terminal cleavage/methylation domain-containing protein
MRTDNSHFRNKPSRGNASGFVIAGEKATDRPSFAFALIELLVVIAIIAILAAIAVPSFTLKKARALSALDGALKKLDPGQIVFNAPDRMGWGETKQATLLLSKVKSIAELEQSLQNTGTVRGHTIKIADVMEAHLSSNDFDIVPISPETQAISQRETTEWYWDIKPKDFGKLPLHLSVNVKVTVDGQERTRAIRTFNETVYVEVARTRSALIFLRNNWQWLWTTILVPVAGWLWHRKRKSRRRSSES